MLHAQIGHTGSRPLIDKGIADLIGDHVDATVQHDAEVSGIHIREAQMADQALVFQFLKPEEAVKPSGIGITPCVELEQIQPLGLHPVE